MSKRKTFHGNQYTSLNSSSSKKIKLSKRNECDDGDEKFEGYRIVDIDLLFQTIHECLACEKCHAKFKILEANVSGLASKFEVVCENCGIIATTWNCRMLGTLSNVPEINRRFTYAMRCMGKGCSAQETFCEVMDLPPPVQQSTYTLNVMHILNASSKIAEESMKRAVVEEVRLTGQRDIVSSGDGTWQTRGHSSQNGVVTLIGAESGKKFWMWKFCRVNARNAKRGKVTCMVKIMINGKQNMPRSVRKIMRVPQAKWR